MQEVLYQIRVSYIKSFINMKKPERKGLHNLKGLTEERLHNMTDLYLAVFTQEKICLWGRIYSRSDV
jgi:hypothetical protein